MRRDVESAQAAEIGRRGGGRTIAKSSIVVDRNLDRYAVLAGNPARRRRSRFSSELIEAGAASRWWELDNVELRRLVREPARTGLSPAGRRARCRRGGRAAR